MLYHQTRKLVVNHTHEYQVMTTPYYHSKESVEEYIHLAREVNGAQLIEKLKKYLSKGASLLELGSGPGTDWSLLNADYQVTGSDNSTEFLKHLKTNHPAGNFLELDAVTLLTDERFDGIYSNKVLHHLKDEELIASIQRQHALLNDQGILCHSFWKGTGFEIFKGLFVNYQEAENLHDFFGSLFDILMLETYAEFEEGDSWMLIAQKKRQPT